MSKAKKIKEEYAISKAFTGKSISISKGKVTVVAEITERMIEINGANGKEFIFKNGNKPETVKLWKNVIGCLSKLVEEIEKERAL